MLAALGEDTPANVFYQPLRTVTYRRAEQKRLSDAMSARVHDKILPAYRDLHDFLRDEYLPRARTSVGLSALPLGAILVRIPDQARDRYAEAAELHALGLAEVERLHGRLQTLLAEAGFAGNAQAFFEAMDHGPHAIGAADELLSFYERAQGGGRGRDTRLVRASRRRPISRFAPVEAFLGATAARSCPISAPPNAERRRFFTSMRRAAPQPAGAGGGIVPARGGARATIFKYATQEARADLPRFRRFGGDPAIRRGLGPLCGIARRGAGTVSRRRIEIRRVARRSLNAPPGWSSTPGSSRKDGAGPGARVICTRSCRSTRRRRATRSTASSPCPARRWPAPSADAKFRVCAHAPNRRLGERFDIRAFHAEILDGGAMPLDILESKVERWLDGRIDSIALAQLEAGGGTQTDERRRTGPSALCLKDIVRQPSFCIPASADRRGPAAPTSRRKPNSTETSK